MKQDRTKKTKGHLCTDPKCCNTKPKVLSRREVRLQAIQEQLLPEEEAKIKNYLTCISKDMDALARGDWVPDKHNCHAIAQAAEEVAYILGLELELEEENET